MTTIISALAKLVLGVTLAIALLAGGGALAAFYFINKNSTPPGKPIFANDKPALTARNLSKTKAKKSAKPNSNVAASPKLEPGAYKARVTWADGLSLRAEPSSEAESIGGLNYNQKIVVLAESDDKEWQRVRSEDSSKQGWVKSGNTAKIEDN